MGRLRRATQRRPGRRVVVGGLAGVLVLAAGAVAWTATATSSAAAYRTATVARATVAQTHTATGSVEPRSQASLAFGSAGTVGAVPVRLGQHVATGQTVARLKTASLQAAVTDAQATLAAARATLASDRASQAAAATEATAAASTPRASAPSGTSTTPSTTSAKTLALIARGQSRVVAAQQAADQALVVAAAALAQQRTACANVTVDPTGATDSVAPCSAALTAVESAQQKVARAQQRLQRAMNALAQTLGATGSGKSAAPATTGSGGGAGPNAGTPSAASGGAGSGSAASASAETGNAARVIPTAFVTTSPTQTPAAAGGSGGSGGGSGGTVTAATLARDQAAIDTARAALIRARQARQHAALRSPIAGTVTAITITAGDTVSSSGSAQVVVAGDGGDVEVTIDVGESAIRSIKEGQRATVTPDGSTGGLPGTVTAIGLMSASTNGAAAYPVRVSVAKAPASLASGSSADVTLVVATARDAITVPSSAVTTTGTRSSVRVLVGG
ncbi:MAG: HlyD family efflux transporter periplasmic adaptor subunit, partial [Actinomycetes bacterium]